MNTRQLLADAYSFHQAGNHAKAVTSYQALLSTDPSVSEAWNNLGVIFRDRQLHVSAIGHFRRAVDLTPQNAIYRVNLGLALWHLKEYVESEAVLLSAVQIDPKITPVAWHTLAHLKWIRSAPPAEIFNTIDRAVELAPEAVEFRWDRALIRLSHGDFGNGFKDYEFRFHTPGFQYLKQLSSTLWTGQDLRHKTLYLLSEQGFGDVIQFLRYLPALPPAGKIIFDLQPALRRLVQYGFSAKNIEFRNIFEDLPPANADFHLSIGSLPLRLGLRVQELQATPYLLAPGQGSNKIPKNRQARKIGIAWAGDARHPNDHERSAKLNEFLTALARPEIELHSLQVGPRANEIDLAGAGALIHQWPLADFADTADLIQQLDGVVCVDTSVAHLAGGLGKACHLLLPYHQPDWRWLGPTWYDSVLRYRQKPNEGWAPVLARVAQAILK